MIKRHGTNSILIDYGKQLSGSVNELFFCSDIHLDNIGCDRNLFKSDLQRAKDRGAYIFIFGDLMDLMQGKYDPRSNKSILMNQHKSESYLLDVINDCYEFLLPFKDNLAVISDGNHETSVAKRIEFNPLFLLCEKLRQSGSKVEHLPYQGWVLLRSSFGNSKDVLSNIMTRRIFYSHGNFHGQVSLGTQAIRRYAAVANADIFVSGDNHERWTAGHAVYDLKSNGEQTTYQQVHIKTGTYKDEFKTGSGFAAERLAMPKCLGGTFVKLTIVKPAAGKDWLIDVENRFVR